MRRARGARRLLAGAVLAIAVLGSVAVVLTWGSLAGPYRGWQGGSVQVVIPRGVTPVEVSRILEGAGVVRSGRFFLLQARLTGDSERLQAGEYEFDGPVTPLEVIERLATGAVILHRLVLPEGLTGAEVIDRVAEMGLAGREELQAAFSDPSLVRDLDPQATDLEGYLFPDTYRLARPTPARQIFAEMVARFRKEVTAEFLARARHLGLGVRDVVTLASLIEKETGMPHERGRISAVFHNRLRRRMLLQCDPTVIYALAADGRYRGSLSREDLRYDSPYNTYVNHGLPPGPIASPGRESLVAALAPHDTPDLYFVADGSGGHSFSRTLEDHLRAVARYRRLQRRGA